MRMGRKLPILFYAFYIFCAYLFYLILVKYGGNNMGIIYKIINKVTNQVYIG